MLNSNQQIADYLQNIATAYEIKNKSRFRIVAYQNAADIAQNYHDEIYNIWYKNPKLLDKIPNFGTAISQKVGYLLRHHQPHPTVAKIFNSLHPAIFVFTKINGIGPIIAHKLVTNLKFSRQPLIALEQLVSYCQQNKISSLPSFGQKSQQLILRQSLAYLGRKNRMSLLTAQKLATKIISYLQKQFPTTNFVALGSLRRLSPTVGDIDLAAASNFPNPIIDRFLHYPGIREIINHGPDSATIQLDHDIHVDLMIKPPTSFGSLLQHFTGSRQHNILLRRHALKLGFSLSEYGIKDLQNGTIHQFATESNFYQFLGFRLIPPSERIGNNELDRYQML